MKESAAGDRPPMLTMTGVRFSWKRQDVPMLEIDKLTVQEGERIFFHGRSGSGKTTLLSLLGGVVVPQEGSIHIAGTEITRLSGAARDRFRADTIGILFQQFNLVPYLSALENVALPCLFSATRRQRATERYQSQRQAAQALLQHMGLDPDALAGRAVNQLSVGQQQRVAAARALIGAPALVIADEPTSALDEDSRHAFLDLLFHEADRAGATVLFVSHDLRLAEAFHRSIAVNSFNTAAEQG